MENIDKQRKVIYTLAGITTIIALIGIVLDITIGNITGGNLSALPQTAIERFVQFQGNKLLGLYNLDFLNSMVQMLIIPAYIALYAIHCNSNKFLGLMSLVLYLFGSAIMVSNNTALPMLELSNKYFTTSLESQKNLYAAAGEGMLAMGAHGSPGIFLGFFIPNIASFVMSIVMLKGGLFSKLNSWFGIAGSILMMVYVILINFVSGMENFATAIAMPGGLLLMAWMIMFTIKILKLRNVLDIQKNN